MLGGPALERQLYERLLATTAAEVRSAAREILDPARRVVVRYLPKAEVAGG
jgi:hypothetical protein